MNVIKKRVQQYTRITSWICAILTMFLAAVALLAKWSIIKPIHDDIVRKYRTNHSIYYEMNPICRVLQAEYFPLITFPIACVLVVVFSLRSRRTSFHRDQCSGYGAIPMPVDFLSHVDRKFAAIVFAVCADEIITIVVEVLVGDSSQGRGVVLAYLLRLLQVLVMGIRYYPLLAAVYLNTFLTLICATLYAWIDFALDIVNQAMCQSEVYPIQDDFGNDNVQVIRFIHVLWYRFCIGCHSIVS